LPPEFVLFGEDASRVVISCDRENFGRIEQVALKYGIAAEIIGETAPERVEIKLDGRAVVSAMISDLRSVYEGALEKALRTEAGTMAAD
jgi:phosphoribosylformylglycinamidine synthase subunit PurL